MPDDSTSSPQWIPRYVLLISKEAKDPLLTLTWGPLGLDVRKPSTNCGPVVENRGPSTPFGGLSGAHDGSTQAHVGSSLAHVVSMLGLVGYVLAHDGSMLGQVGPRMASTSLQNDFLKASRWCQNRDC